MRLFTALSLLTGLAYAGTNTLPIETGAIIQRTHVNKFQTALTGDVVPRNSSGVATSQAGSLGSTTLPWLNTHTGTLKLYTGANAVTLSPPSPLSSGYTLTFPSSLPASVARPLFLTSTGLLEPREAVIQVSNSSGVFSTSDGTGAYIDVTNLSVTLTSNGRPVMLMLQAAGSTPGGGDGYLKAANQETSYRFMRDSTALPVTTLKNFNSLEMRVPVSVINYVDTPPAGTYIYKFQVRNDSGSAFTSTVNNAKLVAREL